MRNLKMDVKIALNEARKKELFLHDPRKIGLHKEKLNRAERRKNK